MDFAFDMANDRVYVIEINPFGEYDGMGTSTCMFNKKKKEDADILFGRSKFEFRVETSLCILLLPSFSSLIWSLYQVLSMICSNSCSLTGTSLWKKKVTTLRITMLLLPPQQRPLPAQPHARARSFNFFFDATHLASDLLSALQRSEPKQF
jgi:hypothetical protein